MDLFVEIENNVYLDTNQIKVVFDYSNKNSKFQALVSKCKKSNKLRDEEEDKRKTLESNGYVVNTLNPYKKKYFPHSSKTSDGTYRYIITRNNELHSTSLTLAELKSRLTNAGVKLIDMSEQSVIVLSYIDAIFNINDELVSSSSKALNGEAASLQFVSSSSLKTNTILWLKTNEIIKLSKNTDEILAQIKEYQND